MSRGKDRNASLEAITFSSKLRRFGCQFRATAFSPFPITDARLTVPVDNENNYISGFVEVEEISCSFSPLFDPCNHPDC